MTESLHGLLEQDEPVALPQIEQALAAQDELSDDQKAALSALVWRRCTSGAAGLLGSVLHQDCAQQIEELPSNLEKVGASDAAAAVRELREAIPLEDEQIKTGLADWIETETEVVLKAKELGEDLEDIERTVWDFMKDPATDIPDIEVPSRSKAILSSIRNFFRSSSGDPSGG